MALTADQVLVILEARVQDHINNTNRAQQNFDQRMRQIERRAQATEASVSRSFRGFISTALVLAAARELSRYADEWTRVGRALQSTEQFFGVRVRSQKELVDIAIRTRSELGAISQLYNRTAIATRGLGLAEGEVAEVTETVAKALKLGGANASEAASTLLQLSQALQKGKLDGDEFRSVMENAGVIQEALIKRLGITKTQLFEMAAAGKIGVRDLVGALQDIRPEVDKAFSSIGPTIAESFTNLNTAITELVGNFSDASGAGDSLAAAVDGIADSIRDFANSPALSTFITAMEYLYLYGTQGGWGVGRKLARDLGTSADTSADTIGRGQFGRRFGNGAASAGLDVTGAATQTAQAAALARLRTGLKELQNPAVDPGAGGAPGVGGKGGRANAFEREYRQTQERIEQLALEREALGLSTREVEKRKAALELEQAAIEANIKITPQMRAEIEQASEQIGLQAEALERARYQFERINEAAMEVYSTLEGGFVDLVTGASSVNDVLRDMLLNLAKIAARNWFESMFSPAQGAGRGLFGGIIGALGSLFTGGRASGGGIQSGKYAWVGEDGPELARGPLMVYSSPNSRRMAASSGPSVVITNVNDFRGVGAGEIARIKQQQAAMVPLTVQAAKAGVRNEQSRTPGYLGKAKR